MPSPAPSWLHPEGGCSTPRGVLTSSGRPWPRPQERTCSTLARDWLGRPLGIEIPPWTRDPQGYYLGGNEMALSPRAMLRVGEMMRQGGRWNGRQVGSRGWIEASLTPVTRSPFSGLGYGYGWFVSRTRAGRLALARGYGGQIIAAAPEAGSSVAITSDPTSRAGSGGYFGDLLALVRRHVLHG